MTDMASKIAAVIEVRRGQLPEIESEIEKWRRADTAVVALDRALADLCGYAATPPEMAEHLGQVHIADVRPAITTAIEYLQRVAGRVGRRTLNIGVSGAARVGKSTMLQSVTGLGDAQLPTGSGIPVTAVRSRIYHVPDRRRAVLDIHTYDTFRRDELQPRHSAAGLPDAPSTVSEFRDWKYPTPEQLSQDRNQKVLKVEDLRSFQQALWSYEGLLEGGNRTLELSGSELDRLREYVAFPTNDAVERGNPERKYLAVRDIRIECPFPYADAGSIGACDLPGLEDASVNSERHHIVGLQHEVDVVLLVKRPLEGDAYWREGDTNAVSLLDEARGFVSKRRDFVFIVINAGGCEPHLIKNLRDHIRRRANDGNDGLHYHVLEADAKNTADVSAKVLEPVLQHLVERLPTMDAEVLAGTRAKAMAVREDLVSRAMDVKTVLRQVRGLTAGAAEDLYRRAGELHKNLAVELHTLLADLRDRASGQDPDFARAVEGVYGEVIAWVRDGLGVGKEKWCDDALRSMIRDGGVGAFATVELSRVRVEISQRYAALDLFFQQRLEDTWGLVAKALGGQLAGMLGELQGQEALARVAVLAAEAAEPCEMMRTAILELLDLRLDYRTQVHPRVRPELDSLNLQVHDPATGQDVISIVVPASADGAEELYQIVGELAEQAAFRIRTELLKEAVLPGQVVFAAVEHFADAVVRSGVAGREIRQLARSYRDQLWEGVYQGLDGADARVARVTRAADELLKLAADVEGRG